MVFFFFCLFKTGFFCLIVLAALKFTFADQAELKLTEIHLSLLSHVLGLRHEPAPPALLLTVLIINMTQSTITQKGVSRRGSLDRDDLWAWLWAVVKPAHCGGHQSSGRTVLSSVHAGRVS